MKIDENLTNNEIVFKSVPILSTVSCGVYDFVSLEELGMETQIPLNQWNKDLYALVANGSGMENEIKNGDICIIDPNVKPRSGDITYYKTSDDAAIKTFLDDVTSNNKYYFVPLVHNESFVTVSIGLDDEIVLNDLVMHKVVHIVSCNTK